MILTVQGEAQTSLTDGLIGYYPLDGDARDLSGYCNHGVVYGAKAAHDRNGDFMTAMSFDGIDNYIEIPHSDQYDFSDDQDMAISFWVKIAKNQMDIDTADNDIISKWVIDDNSMKHQQDGYPFSFRVINQKKKSHNHIYAAQFGGYRLGCRGATALQTKFDITKEAFTQVLLNVKGGKFYLYIDGELRKRKGSNVFCSFTNKAPIRLGKRGGKEFQNQFTGSIDNLAIYNRGLTEEEIMALSNPDLDLTALLKVDDTGELVIADTLYFNDDVFQLTADQRMKLSAFTKFLEVGSQYHVIITGHTNGLPSDDFCDVLSLKRAKVVEQYLYDLGIACSKISTIGRGKRDNIASNATATLRKKNQRAEIQLFRLTKV